MSYPAFIKVKAPAKVNLYLKVLKKRPDGYHDIETLFERITLFDELTFKRTASGIQLRCQPSNISPLKSNLVYRAARLLRTRYDVSEGVFIALKKHIPVGAGLGGGASDAAHTLMALNELWKLSLSRKTLLKHALELGSDVPFFVLNTSFAIGKGRGERLKPVRFRRKIWHVLVTPNKKVLTHGIYKSLRHSDLTRSGGNARLTFKSLQTCNTLEPVIFKLYKALKVTKEKLLQVGSTRALVSGSGSSVFGLAHSKRDALAIARKMRKTSTFPVHVVSTY